MKLIKIRGLRIISGRRQTNSQASATVFSQAGIYSNAHCNIIKVML